MNNPHFAEEPPKLPSWHNIDLLAVSISADMTIIIGEKQFEFGAASPLPILNGMACAIHESEILSGKWSQKFSFPFSARDWRIQSVGSHFKIKGPFLREPALINKEEMRAETYSNLSKLAELLISKFPDDPEILTLSHSLILSFGSGRRTSEIGWPVIPAKAGIS